MFPTFLLLPGHMCDHCLCHWIQYKWQTLTMCSISLTYVTDIHWQSAPYVWLILVRINCAIFKEKFNEYLVVFIWKKSLCHYLPWHLQDQLIGCCFLCWSNSVLCIQNISHECNYANPVYGVATICHQVRWLCWGHPSLFHTATSLLIWYKMFCMWDISYRLIWMEFINMFSVYAQSGTHSRFNW